MNICLTLIYNPEHYETKFFINNCFIYISVQNNFLEKKDGIRDTSGRGNYTIATKTNPYGKFILSGCDLIYKFSIIWKSQ